MCFLLTCLGHQLFFHFLHFLIPSTLHLLLTLVILLGKTLAKSYPCSWFDQCQAGLTPIPSHKGIYSQVLDMENNPLQCPGSTLGLLLLDCPCGAQVSGVIKDGQATSKTACNRDCWPWQQQLPNICNGANSHPCMLTAVHMGPRYFWHPPYSEIVQSHTVYHYVPLTLRTFKDHSG